MAVVCSVGAGLQQGPGNVAGINAAATVERGRVAWDNQVTGRARRKS